MSSALLGSSSFVGQELLNLESHLIIDTFFRYMNSICKHLQQFRIFIMLHQLPSADWDTMSGAVKWCGKNPANGVAPRPPANEVEARLLTRSILWLQPLRSNQEVRIYQAKHAERSTIGHAVPGSADQ